MVKWAGLGRGMKNRIFLLIRKHPHVAYPRHIHIPAQRSVTLIVSSAGSLFLFRFLVVALNSIV